jgi:hypothetical protein
MKGALQSLPLVGKMFFDVQPAEVRAFYRFLQIRFRTTVVNKRDALEMKLVAQVLGVLDVESRDRFLRKFTTTVGRRIFTPFEVGVPQSGWDLWSQMVIAVHEHQHVVQHDREGLSFEVSYLTDRAARARWEAEAYCSNLELHFWRYGTTPSVDALAAVLAEYGCRLSDVGVAATSLALSAESIRRGAVLNEATHIALEWLNAYMPHLRDGGGA